MIRRLHPTAALLLLLLAGCDQLGIESASSTAARHEAEGKAVGAACRHAGRAIEDCFVLNRRTDKAAIYAGWREMDDYMRENKIEAVAPSLAPGPAGHAEASNGEDEARPASAAEHLPSVADKAPADKAKVAKPGDKADKVESADKGTKADKAG